MCAVLIYIVLMCAVLIYAVLVCAVLIYTVLVCAVLIDAVLMCTVLICTVLMCAVLNYTVLMCAVLNYKVLCAVLIYSVLNYLHPGPRQNILGVCGVRVCSRACSVRAVRVPGCVCLCVRQVSSRAPGHRLEVGTVFPIV